MSRIILLSAVSAVAGGFLLAAPVPLEPDAKSLVAGLSDPSEKVRDASSAALEDRADALPWLRRASRSKAPITAARAEKLLAPHEAKRQAIVAKAIDACIRDSQVDLFMEWHHYWKPEKKDDLWPVGERAAKAGMDLYAKFCPPETTKRLEEFLAATGKKTFFHDGPRAELKLIPKGTGYLRTDRWNWGLSNVHFASVAGPVDLGSMGLSGSRCFALGPVEARGLFLFRYAFIACDGDFGNSDFSVGVVVCRGNLQARNVAASVLLADGDIDLTSEREDGIKGSLIRASGEIRLPKNAKPENSKIEAHAKDATAPYKFFELSDVGLSLADDEEGLVVTAVKADTPFGNCGIARGDLIRAVDDADVKDSEEFRKKVRRALVRQGDCLVTITRGNKALDLPVFFPLPK